MKKSGFFWVSFSDLMMSLFFIMLVLYVISFALYKGQITSVSQTIKELEITKTKLEVCESEIKKLKHIWNFKYLENMKLLKQNANNVFEEI